MTTLNPNRYPVDLTGTAASNKISSEPVMLTTRKVRVFSPLQAPFFAKNIIIVDTATGQPLTATQYKCYNLLEVPTKLAGIGNEVYSCVVVTDQGVSNNLIITYQTVGGDYVSGFDSIVRLVKDLTQDSRPVTWDNVIDRPTQFEPNQHLHPVSETIGWEYLISAIQQLATVLMLGDDVKKDFILQYIDAALANSNAEANANLGVGSPFGQHVNDTNNPHGVTANTINLGNVQNFPIATLTEVFAGIASNRYVTVDQVATAVQNAVNLGMDAHIARTDNPHGVTKALVGLSNVLNYATAIIDDLNAPDSANPLYVTNVVLAAWLSQYFTAQAASIATTVAAINASITSALNAATDAKTAALAAQNSANLATNQTAQAVNSANAALTQAQLNATAVLNSQSAAMALISQYVTQAVAAAETAGYDRGYAAGRAAA